MDNIFNIYSKPISNTRKTSFNIRGHDISTRHVYACCIILIIQREYVWISNGNEAFSLDINLTFVYHLNMCET